MLRWLATNLRTFFLAFILAMAVWITAVITADPDETRIYPYSIPIEFIGQDPALVMTGTVSKQVQLTLRAPRSVLDALVSNRSSIRATVDLTGLESGSHTAPVQIQITAKPVRIVAVTPSVLEITLEKLVTQTLPVDLAITGKPATGYKVGQTSIEPMEVAISGPESLVRRVRHISAVLDLNNARQNIKVSLPLVATDENGVIVTGVTLHTDSVEVTAELVQQGGYRDLAVKVVTFGQLANGYGMISVTPAPLIVTVYSDDPALLESLPGYVETTPLNISGATSNIETQVTLNLPEGVLLIGGQTVFVRIEIVPIEGSITITNRPVEIIGLDPNLRAQVSPRFVDVILSGPLPILDRLLATDVHVRIDITGMAAGTYYLVPVVMVANEQVVVQSILPGTLEVVITGAGTPTPKP